MAIKEPKVRADIELRDDMALAIGPAAFGDRGDAIEHQHGWQGQLRIARPEQIAASAAEEILIGEAIAARHTLWSGSLKPIVAGNGAPMPVRCGCVVSQ